MTPELLDLAPGSTSAPVRPAEDLRDETGSRLESLASLNPNWDGYEARRLSPLAIQIAQSILEQMLASPLPLPKVFPVPDGGVQLEWRAGPIELELEVGPTGEALFICDDAQAGQEIDGELPDDSSRFALAIQRLLAYS